MSDAPHGSRPDSPPRSTPPDRSDRAPAAGHADTHRDGHASRLAPRLRDLVRLFLWLGATAFGGPAVHIALMDDAIVRQRGWLPRERFLRLLGLTNLLPGPNSTEMAMHVGQVHGGAAGLVLAGAAFILPAALMSTALAWAYARYGLTAPVGALLYGLKPVVVAVVAQALWRLAGSALRTRALWLIAAIALGATIAGLHELGVLLAAGLLHLPSARRMPAANGAAIAAAIGGGTTTLATTGTTTGAAIGATIGATTALAAPSSLAAIFLVFLKIGSVLFGSGYVLLLFLRADLVERLRWISEAQLLDAIAVGQIVPGPVTTTVTFIGYLLAGPAGALVSTVAVFLPAFLVVALSGRLLPVIERSRALQALLDGVVAGSLALMAVVLFELARAALIDLPTLAIALGALIALVRFRANPAWCVAGAALAGLLVRLSLR